MGHQNCKSSPIWLVPCRSSALAPVVLGLGVMCSTKTIREVWWKVWDMIHVIVLLCSACPFSRQKQVAKRFCSYEACANSSLQTTSAVMPLRRGQPGIRGRGVFALSPMAMGYMMGWKAPYLWHSMTNELDYTQSSNNRTSLFKDTLFYLWVFARISLVGNHSPYLHTPYRLGLLKLIWTNSLYKTNYKTRTSK